MISAVIEFEDKSILIHSYKTKNVGQTFKPGFYIATEEDRKISIKKKELPEVHDIIKTKDNIETEKAVESFFDKCVKEKVNKLSFTHKLGILLYGKQGTGKTSVLNSVANKLVKEKDAIVFICNNPVDLKCGVKIANDVREIQSNPIAIICDEFERFAEHSEAFIKNLLDGVDSIDNSLFLAATNYIDKVPNTLKDRPSRLRIVKEMKGIQDKSIMYKVLEDMSNKIEPNLFTRKEIETIVKNIDSTTLDELKHTVLDKVTETIATTTKEHRKVSGFCRDNKKEEDIWGYDEDVFSPLKILANQKDEKNIKTDSNI